MRRLYLLPFAILSAVLLAMLSSCSSEDETGQDETPQEEEKKKEDTPSLAKLGLPDTGLPVVVISTPDNVEITSKTEWIAGATYKIYNTDTSIDSEGTTSIKGRGNSTWGYPKKPYAMKFDKKSEVLGMAKSKRWDLLANWMDRTLIRNAVSYDIARFSEPLEWTPSGKFVEIVLNGKHLGNYYLIEHIKIDSSRVNIKEMDISDTDAEDITGGYIMELDVTYDETYKFRSRILDLPWQFKDPDEVNSAQFSYMENYVAEMEKALTDSAEFSQRKFADYMELKSFADWWIMNEAVANGESAHPKSVYMHKNRNGKFVAGPVWDYDWGTFRESSSFRNKNSVYFPYLFQDKDFINLVKERWAVLKPQYKTIPDVIDRYAKQLEKSDSINHQMWPIDTHLINKDETLTYKEAIEKMKTVYNTRINWLDGKIKAL